ncbi:MAG TPA: ABC transporter permease [Alphaproteobacteria bacterium]|nr:ABC transporter permease [Alphaproteobacteria bacterium]
MKKIKKLFAVNRSDRELDAEMRFHLEKQIELNLAAGMSAEEARRQAMIAFGGVQQTKEAVREQRWPHFVENLLRDVRYALRMLRKSPGFTAVAVLTLALGIGANTAIFSLIDAVLFRALPANHPSELVLLRWHAHHSPQRTGLHSHASYGDCPQDRQGTNPNGCSFSLPFLNKLRLQGGVLSGLAAFAQAPELNLSGNGAATIVNNGQLVSGDYFATLGVKAAAGRTIAPSDDSPTAAPVVMLSYGYWQSAFAGSPSTVGRTIKLNGQPFTIVGVAEPGFAGLSPGSRFDFWLPLSARRNITPRWAPVDDDAGSWWLVIVGRPRPGVSARQVQAALSLLYADETLHEEKPLFVAADAPGIDAVPAQQGLEGERNTVLQPLYVLMMAVALVLLIACANIAGLLLARSASRSKEIAVRLTLGAKRGRLVSQLLMESMVLSVLGAALGLVLARWAARVLLVMTTPAGVAGPPPFRPQLDWRVLAFTAGAAVFTGMVFGLVPALRSLHLDLTPALKSGTGVSGATSSKAKWYGAGNALVVAQVSLAIVALVVAGLLVRTLSNLKRTELGFDAQNILVFHVSPQLAGYKGPQIDALNQELQEQIAALPGVTSVTYSWATLLSGWEWETGIHAPGTPPDEEVPVPFMPVGPGFFHAMRIPLKAGRDFYRADFAAAAARAALPRQADRDPKAPPVTVIVNDAFVRRYFPHANPLGQRLEEVPPSDPKKHKGPGWEIIGVCGDARYDSLRGDINPTMYSASSGEAGFSVRTAADPLAMVPLIRNLINRKDANLPMNRIASEAQQIDQQVFNERLIARLSSFFGLLALLLACTGIYGLLSYEVTRRTREIGIRMAIGARQRDVVRMVIRQGFLVALAGAGIGTAASFAARGLLTAILYRVRPGDPVTLAAVAVLLLLVALAACYLPARRATKVDPMVALRQE